MNFKSLREDKLKLLPEQFAEIYGLDISEVHELDANNNPRVDLIQAICEKTGMSFEAVTSFERPKIKEFVPKYTWEKADFRKKTIVNYINDSLERMSVLEKDREKYIDDFNQGFKAILIKPSISIVGRSDTGKSTLINSLIGSKKMPTSWTPTTSIAVYIKHINDRPEFIKDDVWFFANECEEERLWNVKKLYDEEYCNKWKIAAGSIELLKEFGTRQGGGYTKKVGSAVVFIDAPVLLNCDIVDLPGFGTETESDDEITLKAAQQTDVLIYLSQANGFMRIEDIEYLKENIRSLPIWEKQDENDLKPLSNLFVVASQAHSVDQGNEFELNNILTSGYENFSKTLPEGYWDKRSKVSGYEYNGKLISSRFFTYTTDIPSLCEKFITELKLVIEQLPDIVDLRTKRFIEQYISTRKPNIKAEIDKYNGLIKDRERYVLLLKKIDESELERVAGIDKKRKEIRDKIDLLLIETINEYSNYCATKINTDAISDRIIKEGIKNKNDDISCFSSKFMEEMRGELSELLEKKTESIRELTQEYISQYSKSVNANFEETNINADFDFVYEFANNFAKAGIIGGFIGRLIGRWFFDVFLNDALYYLPCGIPIGLAIIASLKVVKLLGGGWERNVAKKIVRSFEENGVAEKYRDAIKKYWDEIKDEFDKAADELDMKWDEYVEDLRQIVNENDPDKIRDNITSLENVKSFFENIPLQ